MTETELSDLIVSASDSLRDVMAAIDAAGEGIGFVTKDEALVGVVTDGDVRRAILEGASLSDPVEQVANSDPVTIRDSWDEQERRRHLTEQNVRSKVGRYDSLVVPILDADRVVDFAYVTENGETLGQEGSRNGGVSHVLVIGGAGYVGSALTRNLLDAGYDVRVLDNAIYGTQGIDDLRDREGFEFVEGDMRSIETVVDSLRGIDAVVHLGALVGDPASGINSQKTLEMNYHSVHTIASICRYHQINRFIFASTCSVYGQSESPETLLSEGDPLNPVSLYAKTKIESERALLDLADENFSPTIFRMATIYGYSQRMRFDLVVNILSAKAHEEGVVPIFGGDQYRPNVHVRDAAQAYVDCLEAPIEHVGGEVFNVGSNDQNYQISEVGEKVAEVFPDAEIDWHREKEDDRSYQVDFSKIRDVLDYEVEETIVSGSREIKEALERGEFDDYTDPKYNNYKTLEDDNLLHG